MYVAKNVAKQPKKEKAPRWGFYKTLILLSYFGRGTGTRTRDLRFWRPSLYQLSYTPTTKDGYAFLMC